MDTSSSPNIAARRRSVSMQVHGTIFIDPRSDAVLRNNTSEKLAPPIPAIDPRTTSPTHQSPRLGALYPAATFGKPTCTRPNRGPSTFLDRDLRTPRLNDIYRHLWLAGLPNAARPLHRQVLLGRSILITEDPNEHLVWFETKIFIKPLPEYLLNCKFWDEFLCSDNGLYRSACGLLLSYAWLVRYQSDLNIAKESNLVPKTIEWPQWVAFMDHFLDGIDLQTLSDVDERYKYGELRLTRLNTIYRIFPPKFSAATFVRGYMSGSTWYNAFFERHFRWLIAVFAILSVLLSALQVGLATRMLQDDNTYHRAAYGCTIFVAAAIAASAVAVFAIWSMLFFYHLLSTRRYNQEVDRSRSIALSSRGFT